MPFVSRDQGNNVTGVFANKQPGFAEENLADDDPAVLAFLSPPPQISPALNATQFKTTINILLGD